MRRTILAHLLTILVLGAAALTYWALRRGPIRDPARRSAEDVLVLIRAVEKESWMLPVYPDYALATEAARARFGIAPGMPRDLAECMLATNDSQVIYRELNGTPWSAFAFPVFIKRFEHWKGLNRTGGGTSLSYAEREVRQRKTTQQVVKDFTDEQARRRMALSELLTDWQAKAKIPRDPFSSLNSPLYRYGLSPAPVIAKPRPNNPAKFFYDFPKPPFIVAGNGPDGDADVDVTRFNAEASTVTQAIDPALGLGANLADLIYDPTNGSASNGDIFFIHKKKLNSLPCPKAVWDEDAFRKQYGL